MICQICIQSLKLHGNILSNFGTVSRCVPAFGKITASRCHILYQVCVVCEEHSRVHNLHWNTFLLCFLFAHKKYKTCFGYQHTIQTVIMLKTMKLHIVLVNSTNAL